MEKGMKQRFPGLHMVEKDLGELYTYLELFNRTYTGYEEETGKILCGIEKAYTEITGSKDPQKSLRGLRNPRNAGRKTTHTEQEAKEVLRLSEEGLSVREISGQTGIAKSTVSRILNR